MENQSKKFLEFNGKNILFLSKDGQWWVAIKPICDALNVDYSRQLRTLKSDEMLGQLWSLETMVDGGGKLRKMVCLPEFYVYGWIFGIQSASPELKTFKWECYRVLYDHFHGALTVRTSFLKSKTMAQIKLEKLEAELLQNETYQKVLLLKKEISNSVKGLNSADKEYVENQLEIWETN